MNFAQFDEEYIRRLVSGDPYVEDHFSRYFSELLFIKLRSRVRSHQLIEDVRQETLLRVLRIVRQKNGLDHPERLGAFVNLVCNNVLMESFREEGRHRPGTEDLVEPADQRIDLEAPLINEQRKREVQDILEELSPKDRDLLRRTYFDEQDKHEICQALGVDSDYLRVLLHRAKNRFRDRFVRKNAASAV